MSSNLIRRITVVLVAAVIPFGAAASSAHASELSPQAHPYVFTADEHAGVGFPTYSPDRSSWS